MSEVTQGIILSEDFIAGRLAALRKEAKCIHSELKGAKRSYDCNINTGQVYCDIFMNEEENAYDIELLADVLGQFAPDWRLSSICPAGRSVHDRCRLSLKYNKRFDPKELDQFKNQPNHKKRWEQEREYLKERFPIF